MRCHFLLQGIIPTLGSNLRLLDWQVGSLLLCHLGSPGASLIFKMQVQSCPRYSEKKAFSSFLLPRGR